MNSGTCAIQPPRNHRNTSLHRTGPSWFGPSMMLLPSLHRLRWRWQLEPAWAESNLAMKVTLIPNRSATSLRHCFKDNVAVRAVDVDLNSLDSFDEGRAREPHHSVGLCPSI